jgi:TRIAD3 protein (E3 ubiquitin-protein ligase RNF216)
MLNTTCKRCHARCLRLLIQADIQGFVACPFCEYGAIIEDDRDDDEFRCQKQGCRVVSCRKCRTVSHKPHSCEGRNIVSGKRAVEEAMSSALIRRCNKCAKPFVKQDGCNEMRCTCGNLQCYICGENKVDGYSHFYNDFDLSSKGGGAKCPRWGQGRVREEVKEARDEAVKRELAADPRRKRDDVMVELD